MYIKINNELISVLIFSLFHSTVLQDDAWKAAGTERHGVSG